MEVFMKLSNLSFILAGTLAVHTGITPVALEAGVPAQHGSGATLAKVGGAAAAVTLAMYANPWFMKNYKEIRALDKKRNPDHILLGDKADSITRFYKWKLKKWGSARSVKAEWREVLLALATDHTVAGELKLCKADGTVIVNPTWNEVLAVIKEEKDEFWQDIQKLEKDHLVYLDSYGEYMDSFGVQADYKKACANAPVNGSGEQANPLTPGEWTETQEKYINNFMRNPWWTPVQSYGSSWKIINAVASAKDYAENIALNIYRPFFKMVKPNYSYAAQVYWKMYTSWQRLIELEELVKQKVAGFADAKVRDSEQRIRQIIEIKHS